MNVEHQRRITATSTTTFDDAASLPLSFTLPPPSPLRQPPPLRLPRPLLHRLTPEMAANEPHQAQTTTDVVWAPGIFFFMFFSSLFVQLINVFFRVFRFELL
jgi:hypothetical protein